MKKIVTIIFLTFTCCSQYKKVDNAGQSNLDRYRVYKIDSIDNYYLIYAKKNNLLYKIVSKKDTLFNCKKIILNNDYHFDIVSNLKFSPVINGSKISPLNVDCFAFDKKTTICIEKNNGIYDLYFAKNIKGLCFIKED